MTEEQFIHWLEGYIKGSKMDIVHRSDILHKIDEVKKYKSRSAEPIIPATWPNSKSIPANPNMYVVNSTADINTFNKDTLTTETNQLEIPFTPIDINKF